MTRIVLKGPVVTEKSLALAKKGEYMFWVEEGATKKIVATEVMRAFGVKVKGVRSVKVAGKTRRRGKARRSVLVREGRKMLVKLAKGEKIDLFSEFIEEKKGK